LQCLCVVKLCCARSENGVMRDVILTYAYSQVRVVRGRVGVLCGVLCGMMKRSAGGRHRHLRLLAGARHAKFGVCYLR
jgi:hypothetical protein